MKRNLRSIPVALWVASQGALAFAQAAGPPPQGVPGEPPPSAPSAPPPEEESLAADLAKIQSRQTPGGGADRASTTSTSGLPEGGASGSTRGLSNVMNPAISANGLFLGGGTTRQEQPNDDRGELQSGFTLQEVELQASAIVDPYFRADVMLAGDAKGVSFEEAYLTTLEIPRLTIRAGQMKAALGRHNFLHTHAFPFLTAPLSWRVLLGPEGLTGPGLSADLLLPLPFYTELNAQVFNGDWRPLEGSIPDDPVTPNDESVPDRRRATDLAYVGHLKTLYDLAASATLELGGSYVGGRNGFGGLTSIVGGDLTLKWRPIEAERYRGVEWTSEYLWVERQRSPTGRRAGGAYSAIRTQLAQRWWIQVRGAFLGVPRGDDVQTLRGEALVAFVPSEFSALRLQYALEQAITADPVHEVFLQTIFSIGPHPSHAY